MIKCGTCGSNDEDATVLIAVREEFFFRSRLFQERELVLDDVGHLLSGGLGLLEGIVKIMFRIRTRVEVEFLLHLGRHRPGDGGHIADAADAASAPAASAAVVQGALCIVEGGQLTTPPSANDHLTALECQLDVMSNLYHLRLRLKHISSFAVG